jgi:hypothetical protein
MSSRDEKDFYHVEVDRPPPVMSLDATDLPQLAAKKLGVETESGKKPVRQPLPHKRQDLTAVSSELAKLREY